VPPLPALVGDPPPLPASEARRRATFEDDVHLSRIYLACRTPAFGQRAWYAADLLAVVLAGGKSSRLYRDLVYERQIAQDVSAYVNPFEAVGDFMVIATVRPGVEPAAVEAVIHDHLARAAAEPPTAEELAGAQSRTLTDYWSALELLPNRADSFSQYTTYFDDPGRLAGEADSYRSVAAEELQELAARSLNPEGRVVVTVVPRAAPAMASMPPAAVDLPEVPAPPAPPDPPLP